MMPQKFKNQKGQLLLEVLFVTAAAALVVSISAQMISVSLKSGSVSMERQVSESLKEEAFEAVRAAAMEKWQNLYLLNKGSANHYHPVQALNKWTLVSGDEIVVSDGVSYTRYFYVDNVSRDLSTRNIETIYNGTHDDPSTQKITVSVTSNGSSADSSEFLERWRNKVCSQTSWSGVNLGPTNCPSTNYGTSTNIDFSTAGSLKLSPQ